MNSILSNEKECYFCKKIYGLERHHVFEGRNRQRSEADGCWVYLCAEHHRFGKYSVHGNTEVNLKLKKICQKAWEQKNGPREAFIKRFGRTWL